MGLITNSLALSQIQDYTAAKPQHRIVHCTPQLLLILTEPTYGGIARLS